MRNTNTHTDKIIIPYVEKIGNLSPISKKKIDGDMFALAATQILLSLMVCQRATCVSYLDAFQHNNLVMVLLALFGTVWSIRCLNIKEPQTTNHQNLSEDLWLKKSESEISQVWIPVNHMLQKTNPILKTIK